MGTAATTYSTPHDLAPSTYTAPTARATGEMQPTFYLIDSDTKARGGLKQVLLGLGHPSVEFDSVERFLSLIDREPHGVIVCELQLDGSGALGLLESLRDKGWKTPVLIVTAQGDVSTCAMAFGAGALAFLEKPVEQETFLPSILAAVDVANGNKESREARDEAERKLSQLTSREREILDLLVAGNSMKAIASSSGTSFQAVARHRQRILEKLGLNGDVALVRWMFRLRSVEGRTIMD